MFIVDAFYCVLTKDFFIGVYIKNYKGFERELGEEGQTRLSGRSIDFWSGRYLGPESIFKSLVKPFGCIFISNVK